MQILVAGGGPAGMLAAAEASAAGASVTLLEQNEKLGKKLFLCGKGRCNVTNNCEPADFFENIPRNSRFCYSAVYGFLPKDIMALLESKGLPLKTERGGRVFPVSDKSSDVIRTLQRYLQELGVKIQLGGRLSEVLTSQGRVTGVKADGQVRAYDAVILAMGGASYPSTGSTGAWVPLLERLGHHVLPLTPALIPLTSPEPWVWQLQGLSLKNVTLTAVYKGKTVFHELGELLFTHFGISGPMVLTLSSKIIGLDCDKLRLHIDLKPGLDRQQLEHRLIRDFEKYKGKQLKNAMNELLPQRLIDKVISLAGLSGEKPVHQISREERGRLVEILKELPVPIDGTRPLEEAIITRGGIDTKEVNPSTMESKLIKGLYFAGEMLDIDAFTGGFNLQLAFSTGALAGRSAAQEEKYE